MKNKKTFFSIFFSIMLFTCSTHINEQKILLQDILINNYPEYCFAKDKFTILGNVYSNGNVYTVIYNQHLLGNTRMTGRIFIFNDYLIVGNYGIINEIPEIMNNKIMFKGIKNDNINFENGIPETILIDGKLYSFEYFNTTQMKTKFIGRITYKYYGPPNYGEGPVERDCMGDLYKYYEPPNYSDDHVRNKLERYFVLLLDEPIYINFYGKSKIISEIQLIIKNVGQISEIENYCVYGIPFSTRREHHHTELVLIVNRVDENK
jgi:hypothetical protein